MLSCVKPENNFGNLLFPSHGSWGLDSGGEASLGPWTTSPTPTFFGEWTGSLIGKGSLSISLGWLASEPQGFAVSASPALGLLMHLHQALLSPSFSRWWEAVDVLPRSSSCSPLLLYQHSPFPATALNSHDCTQHLFLAAKGQLKVSYPQNLIPYLYHLSQR